MPHAIEVGDLFVQYRGRRGRAVEAVRGLTFQVQEGEVVGFLGPNGAGKSSTLKALMGFVPPKSGACRVFGIEAGTNEAKARVGYLPEVALYYPFLNPLETLQLYGELQGLGGRALKEEASSLLELVGLKDATRKQNRTLSKGMLQRVGIAQALLGNPELLVLDEVTSGLDPIGRQELRTILLRKRDEGATLFFSSHELAEVEMLCDRILVVHEGRLVEERTLGQLKDELRRYMLVLTGGSPQGILAISALATEVEELSGRWQAKFADKGALIQGLQAVHEARMRVIDVVAEEGSLEEYFVETVRRAA